MAKSKKIATELTFVVEKATKNAIRYKEVCEEEEAETIGSLYIKKTGLAKAGINETEPIVITIAPAG